VTQVSRESSLEQDILTSPALGERIRALRTRQRLRLTELATRAGVSKSLISQVERGLASPSIDTLRQLASALGVPVFSLFLNDGQDRTVVRRGQRRPLVYPGSRVSREIISPDLDGRMALVWVTFPPHEKGATQLVQHTGEETIVVIRGTIEATIGTEIFHLEDGDSITFDPQLPHGFSNPADHTSELLVAISCPDAISGRSLSQRQHSSHAVSKPAHLKESE
jgi:transcriptional regulator with XRE-family HTH domain